MDGAESLPVRCADARGFLDDGGDLLLQRVHARVGVGPGVAQGVGLQRPLVGGELRRVQQGGAGRHQQPDGKLHRVHVVHQALGPHERQ